MSKRSRLLQATLPLLLVFAASPAFAIQGTYHAGVCEYEDAEGNPSEANCCSSNVDCGANPSDGSDCSVAIGGVVYNGDFRDPI